LPQLYRTLCERLCSNCGLLAPYVYLPTCSRYCPGHFKSWAGLLVCTVETEEEIASRYTLDRASLSTIPSYRFISATFTNGLITFRVEGSRRLYESSILSSTFQPDPNKPLSSQYVKYEVGLVDDALQMVAPSPSPNKRRLFVERSIPPLPLRKSMAAVYAPWLSRGPDTVEQGYYCALCRCTFNERVLYTSGEIEAHLRNCRGRSF
jgi:RNA polymerase subunit RPABC4/transcription elongation factor Spt4